jgi:hypothetical protein
MVETTCTNCGTTIAREAPSKGVQFDEHDHFIGELVQCECGNTCVRETLIRARVERVGGHFRARLYGGRAGFGTLLGELCLNEQDLGALQRAMRVEGL